MTETDAVYMRLAEADGATFTPNGDGEWSVKDNDGLLVAGSALSLAEAARLYCEDKGLPSPQEILDKILTAYRPYHVLSEFWDGFRACQHDPVLRCNPHRDDVGVKARAWDRGANVAMQYQQALAHRATVPAEADEAEPGWLVRLLRTGRR